MMVTLAIVGVIGFIAGWVFGVYHGMHLQEGLEDSLVDDLQEAYAKIRNLEDILEKG